MRFRVRERVVRVNDSSPPIPRGTKGTVAWATEKQVGIVWDNGCGARTPLCYPANYERFEPIKGEIPSPEREWLADWLEFHETHSLRHRLLSWRYVIWPLQINTQDYGNGKLYSISCSCGTVSPYMAAFEAW